MYRGLKKMKGRLISYQERNIRNSNRVLNQGRKKIKMANLRFKKKSKVPVQQWLKWKRGKGG